MVDLGNENDIVYKSIMKETFEVSKRVRSSNYKWRENSI